MASRLLRKLSHSAFTSASELEMSWGGTAGFGKYMKLEDEAEDEERGPTYNRPDLMGHLTAEGRPAYHNCSRDKKKKKKKKKNVPKGYLPVLVMGTVDEDEEDAAGGGGGGGDVSGGGRCKCDVSGGCGCGCSWHVYVIRVCVLGHPLLGDLLRRSWQQFGYSHYAGALRLPCDSHTFENLLTLISS